MILVQFTCISQTTDTLQFSKEQSIELYKGLVQGSDLKDYVQKLNAENENLLSVVKKDSVLNANLKAENESLKKIIALKEEYAAKDKEQDKVTFKRVRKGDLNRWGIGPIGGYVLSSSFSLLPAIGIGVSYDVFRF